MLGYELMLAQAGEVRDLPRYTGSHLFQEKIDGVRALMIHDERDAYLFSRTGKALNLAFLDLMGPANELPAQLVLDGEITSEGGFEVTNWRAGLKHLPRNAPDATFMAFDLLRHPLHGDVRGWTLRDRLDLLTALPLPHGFAQVPTSMDGQGLLAQVAARGGEGLVAKRLDSKYHGGRSPHWRKLKLIQTTSCIAVGYEDSDARAIGAVLVALLDGSQVRQVGRVGAGLTDITAARLRRLLDQVANGTGMFPVIEVAHLGTTSGGKLRQPVFKGIREDVNPFSCTYSQIEN